MSPSLVAAARASSLRGVARVAGRRGLASASSASSSAASSTAAAKSATNTASLLVGAAGLGLAAVAIAADRPALQAFHVSIGDDPNHGLHPPHHHWEHHSPLKTFDHAAIRRGFQVYKEGGCFCIHHLKYSCYCLFFVLY